MSRHYTKQHFRNHKSICKNTTDRRAYKILTTIDQNPFPDGYWHINKNGLYPQEYRKFRNWKNTRKFQWKGLN